MFEGGVGVIMGLGCQLSRLRPVDLEATKGYGKVRSSQYMRVLAQSTLGNRVTQAQMRSVESLLLGLGPGDTVIDGMRGRCQPAVERRGRN